MTSRFQINWLDNPEFKDWLEEVPSDTNKAKCKVCHVSFSLSNMGRRSISSHAKGKEHKMRINAVSQTMSIKCFTTLGDVQKTNVFPSSSAVSKNDLVTLNSENAIDNENMSHSAVATPHGLKSFMVTENVIKAEILWCLHTIVTHKSMRMSEKDVTLFKTIFPDSEIAQKMKLQKSKIAYSVLYGIAPFFKNELLEKLSKCKYLSVGFDEALNKISQKTQMDVNVRFWCYEKDEVCARYLTSIFLSRSTSDNIRHSFKIALSAVNLKALVQISMDGPNVNLKFYKDLKAELNDCDEDYPVLLNIGTCGLHVLHGAFKKGIQVTDWSLVNFFRCLYNLFKDVPARRALYVEYSGSNIFPRKFCSVRWLQNGDVAQRAIDMLPHLRKFVQCVRKEKKEPSCASFKTVSCLIEDQLLEAKLAFFKSVSTEVEPFLKEYQTDIPLVPFLYNSLSSVVQNVMSRFVEENICKATTSIHRIDLTNDKNLLSVSNIDLGYGTRSALRKRNKERVSDRDILNFRKECAACLKAFTEKLLERSPLLYPLTKAVTCFDPSVALNQSLGKKRIKNLLTILEEHKVISDSTAEKAEREFLKICSDRDMQNEMKLYKRQNCRVDVFWRKIFDKFGSCETILDVMKIVMILSHGNANVERGFSVNSECLVENLQEDTLIAQRFVYDKIKTSVGDVNNFGISKSLIHSYKNARSALTEATKRKEREMLDKEREDIKRKKKKLLTKELNNKIAEIQENANKEISVLMEEIKSINE